MAQALGVLFLQPLASCNFRFTARACSSNGAGATNGASSSSSSTGSTGSGINEPSSSSTGSSSTNEASSSTSSTNEASSSSSSSSSSSNEGGEAKVDIVPYGWQILKPISEILASKNKGDHSSLRSGSAIVIVEAPEILKTAEPMPMLRKNDGLLQPGDVGRIIDRRPKGVWAVRFTFGAYLIDGRFFKPFQR